MKLLISTSSEQAEIQSTVGKAFELFNKAGVTGGIEYSFNLLEAKTIKEVNDQAQAATDSLNKKFGKRVAGTWITNIKDKTVFVVVLVTNLKSVLLK